MTLSGLQFTKPVRLSDVIDEAIPGEGIGIVIISLTETVHKASIVEIEAGKLCELIREFRSLYAAIPCYLCYSERKTMEEAFALRETLRKQFNVW